MQFSKIIQDLVIKELAEVEDEEEMLLPENPETLYGKGELSSGMSIPNDTNYTYCLVCKTTSKNGRVVIKKQREGSQTMSKHTYTWDGYGYKKGGKYLRKDGIY